MSKAANRARGPAHQTRATESRQADPVHDEHEEEWKRGATLEMPKELPGMVQRWIRFETHGQSDMPNYMSKRREGWEPRKADTVPSDFAVPSIANGTFAGCIVVQGMVLCHRPQTMSDRRQRHFERVTQNRTDAINSQLQRVNNETRNPAFGPIQMETESKRVREVKVASD